LLIAIPFVGFPLRSAVGKLSGAPWWLVIGGLCNVTFLLASLTVTKKLGSGTFTTLVVVSAVVTSVILDISVCWGLTSARSPRCARAAARWQLPGSSSSPASNLQRGPRHD
jgi:uncharacterized membrane protein YdcZ (DUF606 family)